MFVGFGITDYFFDTDDYTSPLKVNFRNDIIFTPASGLNKLIDVKIRSNIMTDQPSPYPFSESQSYEFYSINEITKDIVLSQNGEILQMRFSLDNQYLQMSRSVYSLADMIGQVGGFGGMLISIFSFVVGVISTKIYQQSIMSDIYQVSSDTNNRFASNKIIPEENKESQFKRISSKCKSEIAHRYRHLIVACIS